MVVISAVLAGFIAWYIWATVAVDTEPVVVIEKNMKHVFENQKYADCEMPTASSPRIRSRPLRLFSSTIGPATEPTDRGARMHDRSSTVKRRRPPLSSYCRPSSATSFSVP